MTRVINHLMTPQQAYMIGFESGYNTGVMDHKELESIEVLYRKAENVITKKALAHSASMAG